MDRIWLKSYPPGVPADINPEEYRSIVALLDDSFQKYRDRKAFVCMDKAITYGAVSYTHLDVYKRQEADRATHRRPATL